MDFLKLAIVVGLLLGTARAIQLCGRHCRNRFGHSFFAARGFLLAAIAINFIWWGFYAWATAALHHAQPSGGLALMALGIAAAGWLTYENVHATNALYGVVGSSLQFVLFFPVALYGLPLVAVALIFLLFATYKGAPAWLIGL
ncbi:hypothetical protein ACFQ3P_39325 [Paraburkholderia sabiae]|uniref:Uncharacterized protein n=1 Tax=Paraburkholderia sabiae TaxID=273251 RepID=A0ABU9QR44_9BURK|nr:MULTISPECIES: hypothetical protein [Burkholderiaceae]MDR5877792.1 hypothetical protein [Caballeronia sp. LZ032]WJZ75500.1 hypothetical protein QEN71_06775 [Paraburkholderia sabiae]CAD6562814.1 hypothetical protein LMG24235_08055 [Paraburkholderia sabiae]